MLTQRRMLPTSACTTTAFLAFVFQSRQYPKHWLMVSMVQQATCSSNRREDISVVVSEDKGNHGSAGGQGQGGQELTIREGTIYTAHVCVLDGIVQQEVVVDGHSS